MDIVKKILYFITLRGHGGLTYFQLLYIALHKQKFSCTLLHEGRRRGVKEGMRGGGGVGPFNKKLANAGEDPWTENSVG